MKTFLFILIVISSGAVAGIIHGSANLIFVEPSLDQAIGIENQHLFASGEEKDTPEFRAQYDDYRIWQKSGQVLAGGILGISMGSLFGIFRTQSFNYRLIFILSAIVSLILLVVNVRGTPLLSN